MTGPWRRLHVEEDGLSAGAESLVFGILIFLAGTIVVINGWYVLDTDFAVNAAAREATRAVVESSLPTQEAAIELARDVAEQTIIGHNKDVTGLDVQIVSNPWGASTSGTLERCQRVTIRVQLGVQGISVPFLGSWTPVTAEGQHTELVDPLRSGLRGEATCV